MSIRIKADKKRPKDTNKDYVWGIRNNARLLLLSRMRA
jgi:hypothetical protein